MAKQSRPGNSRINSVVPVSNSKATGRRSNVPEPVDQQGPVPTPMVDLTTPHNRLRSGIKDIGTPAPWGGIPASD